jgi:predicted esterase
MKLRPLVAISIAITVTCAFAQSTSHNFSVKDDIAMTHFSDPSDAQEDFDFNRIKYSPDGQHVAIVTTRGLLESDQIESTISIFGLGEIEVFLHHPSSQAPRRQVAVTVKVRPHSAELSASTTIIRDVQWSSDSTGLYFRAMNTSGAMQLESVQADGSHLRRLTPPNYSVDRYDVKNSVIVYTAARLNQAPPSRGGFINRDALVETGYKVRDILFPGQVPSYSPQTFVLGTIRPGDGNYLVHQVPGYTETDVPLLLSLFPFQLSTDGQEVAVADPVQSVPQAWRRYDPEGAYEHFRLDPNDPTITKSDNGALRPRRYVLINLKTGKSVPLVDAPNARSLGYVSDLSLVAWAPDQTRVLVTNVFLPLGGPEASALTKPCRLASVELPSMQVRCILFQEEESSPHVNHIDAIQFGRSKNEILVSTRLIPNNYSVQRYGLEKGSWKLETSSTPSGEASGPGSPKGVRINNRVHVEVYIKQSLNDPPTLWASDAGGAASREVWDPNPQFKQLRFGKVTEYRWTDATGVDWIGGLVMPVGYVPGKRYPLVLQLYVFHQAEFLTDGTEPTAFAARELASDGFVVLQIKKASNVFSDADAQMHLEAFRSAIRSLSDSGLVDPQKVGLVGFSQTAWHAENAIVHAPDLFAAATIADGMDYNYMQYMLFGPGPTVIHEQMDRVRGGSPFGSAKELWFQQSLGFHLDRVKTPVRIEAINPASVLQEWELYSGLYMQHKPVDLIYFPDGTHVHERPLERYESQQGNIDWLRFWLQGYEDPDPHKRAEYERWEAMKAGPAASR